MLIKACAILGTSILPSSAFADELVDLFERACISTLPDFANLESALESTGFLSKNGKIWVRESDGASFQIKDASDHLACMLGLTGTHDQRFETGLKSLLDNGDLGRFQAKRFQGRDMYLLQTQNGMTILEVIPPHGATTFLVANSRKE